jgi:hypothetical protein
MAAPKTPEAKNAKLLEDLLEAVQDLFILQALEAGAKGEQIRKLLHVNLWRVTNVSKLLKGRKSDK